MKPTLLKIYYNVMTTFDPKNNRIHESLPIILFNKHLTIENEWKFKVIVTLDIDTPISMKVIYKT